MNIYNNPLSLLKEAEVIISGKEVVYEIHILISLAYKSSRFFKKTTKLIKKL